MADTRTPEQRSRIMAAVRSKHTSPEMTVRRWLFARGYRYRLHRKDLAGRPDRVLPSRRVVIFVHGCFWHGHGCAKGKLPKSRLEFWSDKIRRNRERDAKAAIALQAMRWRVLTIWQCETRDSDRLAESILSFLEGSTESTSPCRTRTNAEREAP